MERTSLIEQIGTAAALAETASSTDEYLKWSSQEVRLRNGAKLTDGESDQAERICRGKVKEYTRGNGRG